MPLPILDHTVRGATTHPPLVLLHSGGMSRREWDPFLPEFERHFRLVVPSALGHASSPKVPEMRLGEMAEAVLDLLDRLEIPRAHWLGSSMGGRTALWVARHRPERVDRLVLFRSGYRFPPETHTAIAKMAEPETWRAWGLERWVRREHDPQGGPDAWREVIRKVTAMLEVRPGEPDVSIDELAHLAAPTLLIAGDRDPVLPIDDVLRMYRTIPDAALWIVPRATHFVGADSWRLEAFVSEVSRFLRRV